MKIRSQQNPQVKTNSCKQSINGCIDNSRRENWHCRISLEIHWRGRRSSLFFGHKYCNYMSFFFELFFYLWFVVTVLCINNPWKIDYPFSSHWFLLACLCIHCLWIILKKHMIFFVFILWCVYENGRTTMFVWGYYSVLKLKLQWQQTARVVVVWCYCFVDLDSTANGVSRLVLFLINEKKW